MQKYIGQAESERFQLPGSVVNGVCRYHQWPVIAGRFKRRETIDILSPYLGKVFEVFDVRVVYDQGFIVKDKAACQALGVEDQYSCQQEPEYVGSIFL